MINKEWFKKNWFWILIALAVLAIIAKFLGLLSVTPSCIPPLCPTGTIDNGVKCDIELGECERVCDAEFGGITPSGPVWGFSAGYYELCRKIWVPFSGNFIVMAYDRGDVKAYTQMSLRAQNAVNPGLTLITKLWEGGGSYAWAYADAGYRNAGEYWACVYNPSGVYFALGKSVEIPIKGDVQARHATGWADFGLTTVNIMLKIKIENYANQICYIDRDNDGIPDKEDKCPDTPGLAESPYYGCPECKIGETKCEATNYYECLSYKWVSKGLVAGKCGYMPTPPPTPIPIWSQIITFLRGVWDWIKNIFGI